MNNYYKNKYETLLKKEFNEEESIKEIFNVYLDDKPKSLKKMKRRDLFWSFIEGLNLNNYFSSLEFRLCIKKAFNENYIFKNEFIKDVVKLEKKVFLDAIKYSKIFLKKSDPNFINIKNYYNEKNIEQEFFLTCDIISNKYDYLLQKKEKAGVRLNSYAYLNLLCSIGLYLMKHVSDNTILQNYELNGKILSEILKDRLKTKDKKKGEYEYEKSAKKVIDLISPKNNFDDLNRLADIVKVYKEYYLFNENEISTFCFDNNFSFELKDKTLSLNVIDISKYNKWLNDNNKIDSFFLYYLEYAISLFESLLKEETFGTKENDIINKEAFIQARGLDLILKKIYGIEDDLYISNNITIPISDTLHSFSRLNIFHKYYFVDNYLKKLESYSWTEAYEKFLFEGLMQGKQRLPIIIANQYDFSNNSNNSNNSNPSFPEPVRNNVEDFYTYDLKNIVSNKELKVPSIFEKPLLKLDNMVFTFPFLIGLQNINTSVINNILNIHYKRTKFRKDEVQNSEKKLATLFEKLGFNVKANYMIQCSEEYEVGDIDLICEKDGYLFVLELKSTYIRTSFENIWNYKTSVLRKASNQLRKREKLINRLIEEENKLFLKSFNKPNQIFSLIIDTSFEFDHEIINGYLKVSMFEMINLLIAEDEILYPDGFRVDRFIKNINENIFWKEVIKIENVLVNEENINYIIPREY
ncbi:hypothetical protein [Arcobacter sp. F2176]|uniref:hypothetical protein n=1 Tax=Arcobacter sp. F2176 TaxID=2044511 RepID=UPI00100AAEB1|nr:hypothetical protein [Arcobacter sp. F2176]RXJ80167.1 hypothetical protein CRU95_11835 [Arcobacter sp. F2176]